MFTIKASHTETFDVNANLERVRDFFTDIKTYIDLMPSLESIHTDNNDVMHWKIMVEVPFVGSFREKFSLEETENTDERVEWSPATGEQFNLMRSAAEFLPKGKETTTVQFSQNIELRRKSATELHLLAGFAGESLISTEMTKHVSEMLKSFVEKACERLEN